MIAINPDDPIHDHAADFLRTSDRNPTHSLVLAEFLAITLRRPIARAVVIEFVDTLHEDTKVDYVFVDRRLYRRGLDLL